MEDHSGPLPAGPQVAAPLGAPEKGLCASYALCSIGDLSVTGARSFAPLIAVAFALLPTAAHAQGWYLLIPPIRDLGRREASEFLAKTFPSVAEKESAFADIVDVSRPLSAWTQVSAFDSAEECETLRRALTTQTDPGTVQRARALRCACISAADPRLAPKSSR